MKIIIYLALSMIMINSASALAVVSDYLFNDTLKIIDGTHKTYGIRLQNPDDKETQIQLTFDQDLATLVDYEEFYTLPPHSKKALQFNITAPKKSKPGDTFVMGYIINELSGKGPGVPVLLKINKNFNVKIDRNPEKFYLSDLKKYIPVSLAAAALLIIFALAFRKFHVKKINYRMASIKKRKLNKWR